MDSDYGISIRGSNLLCIRDSIVSSTPGFCLLIDPVHNRCVLCTYELVIVLSLCGFGVFAILQTVTRFPNVHSRFIMLMALLGSSVFGISIIVVWMFLSTGQLVITGGWVLTLLTFSIGVVLLLDGLHWILPVVYRVDFVRDQSSLGWSLIVLGLVEILLASLVFLNLEIIWFLIYFTILLSAINLALSSQIQTSSDWIESEA